jgi:hypothetical protein
MRELKTKYQDSLLDNKRLQDRIDSLEFYSKTNTNSNAFHNLNATNGNSSNPGSSNSGSSRARTPAPMNRQRIQSSSALSNYNNGINYGNSSSLSGISSPSIYDSYRSSSRQGSIDRTLTEPSSYNSNASNPSTVRSSRQSSPVRTFEPSERTFSSTLPPRPTYDYTRTREKSMVPSSSSSVQLRNRRDSSQERLMRPPTVSSLLKMRRSSFVDSANSSLSKYY